MSTTCTYKKLEQKLIQIIEEDGKNYNTEKIKEAYIFAENAHAGQTRKSGEPYISHPLCVAYILLDLSMDTDTIIAALLHDVVEDTDHTLEEIKRLFGADVSALVDGLTKISYVPLYTKEEKQAETMRKILISMSEDIRVIIIKLADRLHNMRTLSAKKPDKQISTAMETINVYSMLAHRLGLSKIKDEMQDLALKHLDPYAYDEIQEHIAMGAKDRDKFITDIKQLIFTHIEAQHACRVPPRVSGRVKSAYSIFKKSYVGDKQFSEIYDTFAIRVITQSVDECYLVFGIVQSMFTTLSNRFKDYIAMPKQNGYRSLHITALTKSGVTFEVQIRTEEMHETAELGVAAHWKYKSNKIKDSTKETTEEQRRINWINNLLEQQQGADDIEQLTETIKNDLTEDTVYAFTPNGDVITLPSGATAIDFAYAVHTQLGHRMNGVTANNKMVGIDHVIQQGEVIDIKTGSNRNGTSGPKRDWLDIVKTSEARSKIRAWFKREHRTENIKHGKNLLINEFKKQRLELTEAFLEDMTAHYNFIRLDDFLASVGYGGVSLEKIITQAQFAARETARKNAAYTNTATFDTVKQRQKSGVIVDGCENVAVRYAKCCNPLPGDAIIGFETVGHGIKIHKKDCPDITSKQHDPANAKRFWNVIWASVAGHGNRFLAAIEVIAEERNGLLADVSQTITAAGIPIFESRSRRLKNGNAEVCCTVEVPTKDVLDGLLARLRKLQRVISADNVGRK